MPVELQSDSPATDFWSAVRHGLAAELVARGLGGWAVVVRPMTPPAAGRFDDDPAGHQLTPGGATELDRGADAIDLDREARRATIATADVRGTPGSGPRRAGDYSAAEVAVAWADDLDLLIKGNLGSPPLPEPTGH